MSPVWVLGSLESILAGNGLEMGDNFLSLFSLAFYGHFAPQPVANRVRSEYRWCVFWTDGAVREPALFVFVIHLRNLARP